MASATVVATPAALRNAMSTFPALKHAAASGQILTYAELASKVPGLHHRHLGRPLGIIHELCKQNNVPDLAALVVNANSGKPGMSYTHQDESVWKAVVDKVHGFDWTSVKALEGKIDIAL